MSIFSTNTGAPKERGQESASALSVQSTSPVHFQEKMQGQLKLHREPKLDVGHACETDRHSSRKTPSLPDSCQDKEVDHTYPKLGRAKGQ